MNTEKFGKTFIQDKARTRCSIMSNKFKNSRKIGEDCFQVLMHSTSYNCDTCIHEAYFTLDNAKYWYLVFIYEFMYKCLDMEITNIFFSKNIKLMFSEDLFPNINFRATFAEVVNTYLVIC